MRELTIAVTGLNATDNPGPGVSVIRSLRASDVLRPRIVGLCYDALEPGIYAEDLCDDVFLIPYPSEGRAALGARLEAIHEQVGLDVIIPTLDSELLAFIGLEERLAELGIGTFLPTRAQLEDRDKARLCETAKRIGLPVPESRPVTSETQLLELGQELGYPLVVKGPYYGATVARSHDEARRAFHELVAEWGYPIIAQRHVAGDEVCVVAVGDGRGELIGSVPMKKTFVTDKGKGWAGVTIRDRALDDLTARFMARTKWRGPCEIEVMRSGDGAYHVLEVNPRFPAWVYLAAGAGMNLPLAVVYLAAGGPVPLMSGYRVGTMFVRIAIDQIADIETLSAISMTGAIHRRDEPAKEVA